MTDHKQDHEAHQKSLEVSITDATQKWKKGISVLGKIPAPLESRKTLL